MAEGFGQFSRANRRIRHLSLMLVKNKAKSVRLAIMEELRKELERAGRRVPPWLKDAGSKTKRGAIGTSNWGKRAVQAGSSLDRRVLGGAAAAARSVSNRTAASRKERKQQPARKQPPSRAERVPFLSRMRRTDRPAPKARTARTDKPAPVKRSVPKVRTSSGQTGERPAPKARTAPAGKPAPVKRSVPKAPAPAARPVTPERPAQAARAARAAQSAPALPSETIKARPPRSRPPRAARKTS